MFLPPIARCLSDQPFHIVSSPTPGSSEVITCGGLATGPVPAVNHNINDAKGRVPPTSATLLACRHTTPRLCQPRTMRPLIHTHVCFIDRGSSVAAEDVSSVTTGMRASASACSRVQHIRISSVVLSLEMVARFSATVTVMHRMRYRGHGWVGGVKIIGYRRRFSTHFLHLSTEIHRTHPAAFAPTCARRATALTCASCQSPCCATAACHELERKLVRSRRVFGSFRTLDSILTTRFPFNLLAMQGACLPSEESLMVRPCAGAGFRNDQ
jgi:hypothetical protein